MASELIERDMYGGRYHMVHNPTARGSQPRYHVTNTGLKPKGVTTILGQTLSKDLMEWAVGCMKDNLSKKLPSITPADLDDAASEYKRRRDSGASTGSEAHAMVERFLKGQKVNPEAGTPEAGNAYKAFLNWYEVTAPEVVNVEEVVYSDEMGYAGTYDAMLKINGKVYLTDFKTTNVSRKAPNGVYAEYFIQLGAYASAHEEQRLYEEANGGTSLLPIDGIAVISGRKDGKLSFVTNEDLGISVEECGDLFRAIVVIYRFLTETTKALGGK